MEIARLSHIPHPGTVRPRSPPPPAVADSGRASEAPAALPVVARARPAPVEHVLSGEVLERSRAYARSTRAFVEGRSAHDSLHAQADRRETYARHAVFAYEDHARLAEPPTGPGRRVDYYV